MGIATAAVIGLGRLGTPIAACLASKGLRVIGVDLDASKVSALETRTTLWPEPGMSELLGRVDDRLGVASSIASAVEMADATFIVVPTPSREDGSYELRFVLAACREIGAALRNTDARHVVSITSTVSPGSTWGPIRETLEEASGKVAGVDVGLCYSPEFVALGSVVSNFLTPDFVLIGESDPMSGDALEEMYTSVCENAPPIKRMSIVNAEIAKLALNTFVTTKIAFANMLAELCESVDGGDVDAVSAALGADRRIGPRGLLGGLGYGGPCFPRDNGALAAFASSVGVSPVLPVATDDANRKHFDRLVELARSCAGDNGAVAVLGLAYKPETDVVERSQGLELAAALAASGLRVYASDPKANAEAGKRIGDVVTIVDEIDECIGDVDVIIVTTPWKGFVSSVTDALRVETREVILIDCWRIFSTTDLPTSVSYIALGRRGATSAPRSSS